MSASLSASPFRWLCILAMCSPWVAMSQTAPLPAGSTAGAANIARPGTERQEIRAQLMPRRYTTVAAEIPAKINELPIAEGGAFKAGETLVSFDCSMQRAQYQKAEAELDSAEQTFKSNQRLSELNSVGLLELELSRSALAKAKAELGGSKAVVEKCTVIAPFAGRVAEQKVREQQFAQLGQPLLDIIDDSVLELEFLVPSSWLRWLRVGSNLQVQIDETRKNYPARFIRIGARVDPVSQSIKVVASINGKFPELMAGMSGRVQIATPNP